MVITASVPHKEMRIYLFVEEKNNVFFPSDQQSTWISNNQRVSSGSAACCKVYNVETAIAGGFLPNFLHK